MEIKPSVANTVIFQLSKCLTHFLANSLLAAFFIDQVNEVLLLVLLACFFHMQPRSLETEHMLRVDFDCWWPLHSRLHLPNQRYRSTCLNMCCKLSDTIFLNNYNMLSLCEVGSRAFAVETSCDKPSTWSSAVSAGNQSESNISCLANINESKNAGSSEWCKLRISEWVEQLMIECKLRYIVYAVRKHCFYLPRDTWCEDFLDGLLHALC